MLFVLYRLFTVFVFVREGRLVLVPRRGVIVQVVDVLAVGLFPGAVHLQLHLFIVVLELQSGDQVLSLKVALGEVVHGLRVPLLVPPPPHVARRRHRHAAEHQRRHQADAQTHGRQAQPVLGLRAHVGAGGVRGGRRRVSELTPGAAVVFRADAGRLPLFLVPVVGEAGAAVEAGPRGAAVRRPVAVAARVARRAGAGVVVDAVHAGGAVGAGAPGALVDVDLAVGTSEAREAAALRAAAAHHAVAACRGRRRRRRRSDVSERPRSATSFSTLQIFRGLTVAALHGRTSIHFLLAVGAGVARRTLAHVGVPAVHFSALATEKAGCVCARVDPLFTIRPRKTFRALTPIAAL